MKKFFYVAVALVLCASVFTSCKDEEDDNVRVLTFENEYFTKLIDNPQYGGALLYGTDKKVPVTYSWKDANTKLASDLTASWGGFYGFAEGGIAISNYIDDDIEDHASYDYQLAVPTSNGSQNFAVVYCGASMYFADSQARVIRSMMVSPTTYQLGVVTYGDGYAASLKDKGTLTLVITGRNADTVTGTVTVDMAKDGVLLSSWKVVDLSSLGKVTSLSFSMDGTDKSDYGVKAPQYFAFDNVMVEF